MNALSRAALRGLPFFPGYPSPLMIACVRSRGSALHRSPIRNNSRLAMAQLAGEPLLSVALEEIPVSVSPSLA